MDEAEEDVLSEADDAAEEDSTAKVITVGEWKKSEKKLSGLVKNVSKLLAIISLHHPPVPPEFIRAESVGTISSIYTSGSSSVPPSVHASVPPIPAPLLKTSEALKFKADSADEDAEYNRTFNKSVFVKTYSDVEVFSRDLKNNFLRLHGQINGLIRRENEREPA